MRSNKKKKKKENINEHNPNHHTRRGDPMRVRRRKRNKTTVSNLVRFHVLITNSTNSTNGLMEILKNVKVRMSQSQKRNNLYHFSSNSFDTLFKNQYGHIRLLQRFNQRSPQLQNLLDYCVLVFKFNANALFLPHHTDSKFLLIVIYGNYY